jgi:hypothetical protein
VLDASGGVISFGNAEVIAGGGDTKGGGVWVQRRVCRWNFTNPVCV